MKMRFGAIALACCLTVMFPSWALAANCKNPLTQAEMNICASQELMQAEKKLSASYTAYRQKLAPPEQAKLKEIQLAWIKFKDLDCQFRASSSSGGSVHSTALSNCLIEKTTQRTKEIIAMGTCEEGDVSCRR